MNCPECGAEMKELFVDIPYSPFLGSFCHIVEEDEFGIKNAPIDVMWCPECGRIRGYLHKPSQENHDL